MFCTWNSAGKVIEVELNSSQVWESGSEPAWNRSPQVATLNLDEIQAFSIVERRERQSFIRAVDDLNKGQLVIRI